MKVYSVNSYDLFNSRNKLNRSKITGPNFQHHPDFVALKKDYEILASSYFRRGGFYGSPSEDFADVIDALGEFFNSKSIPFLKTNPSKMFLGGIGESQEPFSLLAVIKSLIGKDVRLSDVLDMYTVDLQSQPNKETLFRQSFYDQLGEPRFVKSSFVFDDGYKYGVSEYKNYRIADNIFRYLSRVYANPQKAQWEKRIQDAVKEFPDNCFDVISVNNTLLYVKNSDERFDAIQNIFRILKSGGIFISDNRHREYDDVFSPLNSKKNGWGIYQKL